VKPTLSTETPCCKMKSCSEWMVISIVLIGDQPEQDTALARSRVEGQVLRKSGDGTDLPSL
jgi:hypothetical protein